LTRLGEKRIVPQLSKKNSYWMTKAGGTETYFGKVADIPHADARRLFIDHLQAVANNKPQRRAAVFLPVLPTHPLLYQGILRSQCHFLGAKCMVCGPRFSKMPLNREFGAGVAGNALRTLVELLGRKAFGLAPKHQRRFVLSAETSALVACHPGHYPNASGTASAKSS